MKFGFVETAVLLLCAGASFFLIWIVFHLSRKDGETSEAYVTPQQQRIFVLSSLVLLVLIPLSVTTLAFSWPSWGVILSTGVFGFYFYRNIQRMIQYSLTFDEFIRRYSRAALTLMVPIGAMALVYYLIPHLFPSVGIVRDIVTAGVGAVFLVFWGIAEANRYVNVHIRGRGRPDLVYGGDIKIARAKDDLGILWGGTRLPSKMAESHFMVVGTTGSGKTITIRLLMQDVLPHIRKGKNHRAIIYDAKQDIISLLSGMGIPAPIVTLNPFDSRCTAWDIAADVKEPAVAYQMATILIPADPNSNQPFFVSAAQTILYGVMVALLKKDSDWRFSDLVRIMQSKRLIAEVLKTSLESKPIYDRYFGNEETIDNIMSSVANKMIPYESIAALWEKAGHRISLADFLKSEDERGSENYILIIGNNEKARAPLDAINRAIFQRLTELLLDQPENISDSNRTWVFLDEVAEAGKLDGLSSLLFKGRSKGTCVVLGFQDIEGLQNVYGEKVANALTGQCNNKAILRLESPDTGQWASKLFGSYEAVEYRYSRSEGQSSSSTYAQEYVNRQSVLESEFYTLPVTSARNGLTGYYVTPESGAFRFTYPGAWLFTGDNKGLRERGAALDRETRDTDDQWLPAWSLSPENKSNTLQDFMRLKLHDLNQVLQAESQGGGTTRTQASEDNPEPIAEAAGSGAKTVPGRAPFETKRNRPQ